jgi:hypothetical protein
VLEREQLWAAAQRAQARRRDMAPDELAALTAAEADVQSWLDAL